MPTNQVHLKEALKQDRALALSAIKHLYAVHLNAQAHNERGKGFSRFDRDALTAVALQVNSPDTLTHPTYRGAPARISKYARQLIETGFQVSGVVLTATPTPSKPTAKASEPRQLPLGYGIF